MKYEEVIICGLALAGDWFLGGCAGRLGWPDLPLVLNPLFRASPDPGLVVVEAALLQLQPQPLWVFSGNALSL